MLNKIIKITFTLFVAFHQLNSNAQMDRRGIWDVNASGAFEYKYPLRLPPGIAGVKPPITIEYNSGYSHDILGRGFVVGGLSTIHRCAKSLEVDGIKGSLSYTNSDVWCLDGVRLVLKSGAYHQDGAIYETQLYDGSKIIGVDTSSLDKSKYFEVHTKAGEIKKFVKRIGVFNTTIPLFVHSFVLESVIDSKGNYWKAFYTASFNPNMIRAVCYTGNIRLNKGFDYCVEFGYGTAQDPFGKTELVLEGGQFTAGAGYYYITGSTIRGIQIRKNPSITYTGTVDYSPQWSLSGEVVLSYQLTYQVGGANNEKYLTSIQECVASNCLPSVAFEWNLNTQNIIYSDLNEAISVNGLSDANSFNKSEYYETISYPDLNGDGNNDLCYRESTGIKCRIFNGSQFLSPFNGPPLSDAAGWGVSQRYSTIQYPDLNRDGKADICAKDISGIVCWIGTGNSFPTSFRGPNLSDSIGWNEKSKYSSLTYLDFNGDSFSDLCGRDADGIVCWLGNGSSFGLPKRGPAFSDSLGWSNESAYSTIRFADINGDGFVDVCGINGVSKCHLSNGINFIRVVNGPSLPSGVTSYVNSIVYADISNDGSDDFCIKTSSGYRCGLSVSPSNLSGNLGFSDFLITANRYPAFTDAAGWSSPIKGSYFYFGDVNQDNFPDVCFRENLVIRCYLGWITNLTPVMVNGVSLEPGADLELASTYSTGRFVDLNNDGKPDYCIRRTSGLVCKLQKSSHYSTIKKISVSSHEIIPIFSSSKEISSFSSQSGYIWPLANLPGGYVVTKEVRESNGIGGFSTTNFRYFGGKVDRQYGRGFLGFEWMESQMTGSDGVSMPTLRSTYSQQWPCLGMTVQTQVKLPLGGLREQTDSIIRVRTPTNSTAQTCGTAALNGQIVIPYTVDSTTRQWEMTSTSQQGSELPRKRTLITLDGFGNVTQMQEQTLNADGTASGYSRTTNNTYDSNAERARQGRLIKSAVTHVKP
ncbi:MAG: FG-GAP repeat domain-containing protein [Limnobacter sp.]|uniref:FG-GAP repeat domain-containing protein n=1 Tax=Limnobacter sp. TaxID=2003368 RepID=UPI004038244A